MARAIRETWVEPHTYTHIHTHIHKRIVPINSRLFRRWSPRECNEESFERRFLRKISRSYFSSFTLSLPSRASPFDLAAPRSFTRDSFLPSLGFSIIRTPSTLSLPLSAFSSNLWRTLFNVAFRENIARLSARLTEFPSLN